MVLDMEENSIMISATRVETVETEIIQHSYFSSVSTVSTRVAEIMIEFSSMSSTLLGIYSYDNTGCRVFKGGIHN